MFPNEKGFVSAQLNIIEDGKFRITIMKNINGVERKVLRYIDQTEFEKIKQQIDQLPEFTKIRKIEMYEGMDYLRAERIINEIPKPQFIVIKHSDNKKLRGTLTKVENNVLFIQGPSQVEEISLSSLDRISYRMEFGEYDKYKNYFYVGTGILGLIGVIFTIRKDQLFTMILIYQDRTLFFTDISMV